MHTAGQQTDRRYEHVTGEDQDEQPGAAQPSATAATRWHWRAPFAKVKVPPPSSLARRACSATQALLGFFKTNNQTADSLWAVIMTTRCY